MASWVWIAAPKSIEENAQAVKEGKTIIWTGPMGVFQMSKFARFATGTKELVDAVVEAAGTGTVIGGSAATACKKYGTEVFSAILLAGCGNHENHSETGV